MMVEFCERVSEMVDADLFIEETAGRTTVVTFLTDGFEDVELMGFMVEDNINRDQLEALEMQIQPLFDIPEDTALEQQEAAEDLHHEPQAPAGEVQGVDGRGVLQPDAHGGQDQQPLQLQLPQEGQIVVGEIIPAQIEVDGKVLTAGSTLSTFSAGNALVENSIQRIRQLACTLMEDVSERTGLTFPCEHPLWSWAGRHAAWCLNRHQVGRSMTAFEVTQGKRYEGKTACFAEPVYGYCKARGKADAKWRVGLYLGKTEAQDAWIIGDGVDVMLTRSIRLTSLGPTSSPTSQACRPTALSTRPTLVGGLFQPNAKLHHNVMMDVSCQS